MYKEKKSGRPECTQNERLTTVPREEPQRLYTGSTGITTPKYPQEVDRAGGKGGNGKRKARTLEVVGLQTFDRRQLGAPLAVVYFYFFSEIVEWGTNLQRKAKLDACKGCFLLCLIIIALY